MSIRSFSVTIILIIGVILFKIIAYQIFKKTGINLFGMLVYLIIIFLWVYTLIRLLLKNKTE
jgi:hypothetical protein